MRCPRRLGAWLTAAAALAATTPAGPRPEAIREIESLVAARMLRSRIPGVTVAVAVGTRLAWTRGFGTADIENPVAAGPDTVYRIGSISKPITAVAAMQLAERGALDLDAPIQRYVPSFPVKPWPVTARQLLAHLSGIRHYRTEAEVNGTRHYANLLDPLDAIAQEPLLFEPGTSFSYSTYGYNLLGAAVEAASGARFLDALRSNIFVPAGMDHTGADDVFALVPHRARGYRIAIGGRIENCSLADTSNKIPGGGLVSTAGDLVRFAGALERGELVKPQTRDLMFTPQRTRDGGTVPYGLGWAFFEQDGKRWMGHPGLVQGVSACLLVEPADGISVAVLANLEGLDMEPLAARIAEILMAPRRNAGSGPRR
jgi:serine beta-lactamase-like protein LACTB, mitochondrial